MLTRRLGFLCRADCKAVMLVRQTPVPHSEQRHIPQAHLDRPADARAGHWQLHPQSPQQSLGLRMQMPLSRGLWVDFILRAPGTGIGEGAVSSPPNCSQRDAVWSSAFHTWELLASRESVLRCDGAQTHSPWLFPGCSPWTYPGQFLCSAHSPRRAQSGNIRSLETQAWQARGTGEVQSQPLTLESELPGDSPAGRQGLGYGPHSGHL